jgi:hypothetical protein
VARLSHEDANQRVAPRALAADRAAGSADEAAHGVKDIDDVDDLTLVAGVTDAGSG